MHEVALDTIKNESSTQTILDSKYLIKENLQVRDYQIKIAQKCVKNNYLVSIPTGLGKTIIAILTTAGILTHTSPNFRSKIVMIAPTKPLIVQNSESFKQFLRVDIDKDSVLTGSIPSHKRSELFNSRRVLFYTPQTLRNDLENNCYGLKYVALLIVDEAHKATGNYAYTTIVKFYHEMNPKGRILALTASPGSSQEQIKALCENLFIPYQNIELRTREDEDVKDYVKEMTIEKIAVDKSPFMEEILPELHEILKERLIFLMECGFLEDYNGNPIENINRSHHFNQHQALQLNRKLLARIQELKGTLIIPGTQNEHLYQALSVNAEVLRIFHMIKTTEAQGLNVLLEYMEQMLKDAKRSDASKALKSLVSDSRMYLLYKTMKQKAESEEKDDLVHPKLVKLQDIVITEFQQNPDARILLFAEFRNTITLIYNALKLLPHIFPVRFVGQKTKSTKDKGMSQKTQLTTLDQFKQGKYNVLVSTSVAEEGLDIAECDVVIFYDAVPSEIRLIQRKGRTARQREGKVIIMYCKNSTDESNFRSSMSKLREMQRNIKITKREITSPEGDKAEEKSKIDRFLTACENARKKTPDSITILISSSLHPKYNLTELCSQNNLKCETQENFYVHYSYFKPSLAYESFLVVILLNPSKIQQGRIDYDEFWRELKQLSCEFENIVIAIDYLEYIELVEGKKEQMTQEITAIASDFSNILVVTIDTMQDLNYLLIPIIKNKLNE